MLTIFDSERVEIIDLGSNFLISSKDLKKRRDKSCIDNLKRINPDVKVQILEGELIDNISNLDLVVITEIMQKDTITQMNNLCRDQNKGFIYSASLGLSGFCFVDLGNEFISRDLDVTRTSNIR